MAYAETQQTTEIILTLSEDEAALLRGLLSNVVLSDEQFTDDDEGETLYDELSELLVGLHSALADAGVAPTYDSYTFEIV